MTSIFNTDQNCPSSFDNHQCYLSGDWLPYASLSISAEDQGFRQGVVAVERLRTYAGRSFQIDPHLRRWQHTVESLKIRQLPDRSQIEQLLVQVLDLNRALIDQQIDVGITIFATPGSTGRSLPTFCLHLNRLDHQRVQRRRELGQPLVVTDIEQPSQRCWPRSIKVRSRIHYYLADKEAGKRGDDAIGVLIDSDGSVTETSIANLAMVQAGKITSPPAESVLGGITQMFVESLAAELGIDWCKRPITRDELRQADEILLMGTDSGIWFASSVDDHPIGDGQPGEVYRSLRDRFDQATSDQAP
jgi:branched-subunit amino acid aminotransferase/4-amino-4-deoxychorismate lyase